MNGSKDNPLIDTELRRDGDGNCGRVPNSPYCPGGFLIIFPDSRLRGNDRAGFYPLYIRFAQYLRLRSPALILSLNGRGY